MVLLLFRTSFEHKSPNNELTEFVRVLVSPRAESEISVLIYQFNCNKGGKECIELILTKPEKSYNCLNQAYLKENRR